jgi:DNA-binding transcriptional LysR family regulator
MRDANKIDNRTPASARFDWADLRVFLHVAEYKSIAAAARALQMAQPTVSQKIRDLELRLNSTLFTRSATGATLTEAGELLRRRALPMQRAADSIDHLVREFDDRLEGRVKIAAPDGILGFWIAPRAPIFQRQNPRIQLSMDGGLWPQNPLRSDLDLSLQYDAANFGEHVVEPLATVHYAPFATKRYLDLYGSPATPAEMVAHRTIHHAAVQQQKEKWDPKAEAVRMLSAYDIETNSSAAIAFSVLADGGISFMPTFVAAFFENLVMLGEGPAASPVLYLVYDPNLRRVARCAKVLDWIKAIFDPSSNPWFHSEFVHPRDYAMCKTEGRLVFEAPASS